MNFNDVIIFSTNYPNIIFSIPTRTTWEVYTADGDDNLSTANILIKNGKPVYEYRIEPYGDFNKVQTDLILTNIHNNNEYEEYLTSLAKFGRLDEVAKNINTKTLTKDQLYIFNETVDKVKTLYEEEVNHENAFKEFKKDQLGGFNGNFINDNPIAIIPYVTITKSNQNYTFIPNDLELEEIAKQINIANESNKKTGKKGVRKFGISSFDLGDVITNCDSLWFQNMPLNKELDTFHINTPVNSYDFLAIKLRGHKIKQLIVDSPIPNSNFLDQINKINFEKLIINSPSPEMDFTKLPPEIAKKIHVNTVPKIKYTESSDILN